MKITAHSEESLLEALQRGYPDSSKRTLRNFLKAQRVTVGGDLQTRASLTLQEGDLVEVHREPVVQASESKAHGLRILFEDEHLIAIDKPVGLLSVPMDAVKGGATTRNALMLLRDARHPVRVFAVHRLDRDTSGVIIFAKSQEAREGMDTLFREHDLQREYYAVVEGEISPKSGQWKSYLVEKKNLSVSGSGRADKGKRAVTHYDVLSSDELYTHLKLVLETGRKHQIRVHCRQAGAPVLGDKRYGSQGNPLDRLCLHAHRLAFRHPVSQEWVEIISPIPKAFSQLSA